MDTAPLPVPQGSDLLTARAVVLGERIDTAGLERTDALSTSPLSFRVGQGLVVVFRYGVTVLIGLDPIAEDEVLRGIQPRVQGHLALREEETIRLASRDDLDEGVQPDGVVRIGALSPDKLLVVADAVAKSAALAHDERQVAQVFDTIEPWARVLAEQGRSPSGRRAMVKLIGSALLVQHRVAERVAVREKPDILWDRPDLERLYARLEDEYELVERAETLGRKLDLIGDTVTVMTDLIDTQRSLRLEAIVVGLILLEVTLTLYQMATGTTH
ncbi:MAG: RMD1 family protein [Phenylobacterium sp.]|nr:RMD1 family protein [Phenylobacterium sp.]MBP8245392.1 RMD1 family protein [Phenylobacterium sp.]